MRAASAGLVLAVWLAAPVGAQELGPAVYADHCLTCHQADGGGVPFLQPPLGPPEAMDGPSLVVGPVAPLVEFLLLGSAARGQAAGAWGNDMPGFEYLSDDELAAVATYIRSNFGNDAGPVAPADVADGRRHLRTAGDNDTAGAGTGR